MPVFVARPSIIIKQNENNKKMKRTSKIIEEELDSVGNDYGGRCMKGIDSGYRICEDCVEFSKHLIARTKKELKKGIIG